MQWRQASFAEPEGEGQDRIMSPHLADVSPAAQATRTAMWTKVEARLATIPRERLSADNQINFAVYKGQIDALLAEQRFSEWQKPANSDSSFWGDLAEASTTSRCVPSRNIATIFRDLPRSRAISISRSPT